MAIPESCFFKSILNPFYTITILLFLTIFTNISQTRLYTTNNVFVNEYFIFSQTCISTLQKWRQIFTFTTTSNIYYYVICRQK